MNEYKRLLFLIYLNTVKESFYYHEMTNILGYSFKQLKKFLIELDNNNYILLDIKYDKIELTEKSITLLKNSNLLKVDFHEILKNEETNKIEKIEITDIYIPKNFKL